MDFNGKAQMVWVHHKKHTHFSGVMQGWFEIKAWTLLNHVITPVEEKTTEKLYSVAAADCQFEFWCGSVRSSAKRCKAFWGDAKFVILVVSKGKRVTGSSVKNIVKFQPQSLSPKNEQQSLDFIKKYLFWNSFKPESMYCNTCYRLLEVWWGAKSRREDGKLDWDVSREQGD